MTNEESQNITDASIRDDGQCLTTEVREVVSDLVISEVDRKMLFKSTLVEMDVEALNATPTG